ncbi:MAG: hypothetical protein P8127_00630 [Acidobacteriota bacterium]
MTDAATDYPRTPVLIVLAAALAGAVMGLSNIANTSIGWHLASGDWILGNRSFLYADPFSFTSGGAAWIDHEWLFQVGVSIAYSIAGPAALVGVRAAVVATLAVLLLLIGVRSGLSPAVALILAMVSVAGAHGRFFVRPELVTLLVVPAAVWLFLRRDRFSSPGWLAGLAGLMLVGANSHGGALAVPPLFAGMLGAEILQTTLAREWNRSAAASGIAGLIIAAGSLLINPYGWRLFATPVRLAHLVDRASIPNPEWVSPSLTQAPALYAAIVVGVVLLALRERRVAYWTLFALATVLALRHIRNIGLFFVLFPLAVAPSLATWPALNDARTKRLRAFSRTNILAVAAAALLAVSQAIAPWPGFGFGWADNYYPESACDFLDAHGLPTERLYNDVRFGGYLIHRYGPERQVFQDDRNEIHEDILEEIWNVFQASDTTAWAELLGRYEASTALVRYHPEIRVTDPSGNDLGSRGFSTLWFPQKMWALVYWDDVAMVFVRRDRAPSDLIDRLEYRIFRPDDLSYLERRLREDPSLIRSVTEELYRAKRVNPTSWRAQAIGNITQR